MSVSTFVRPDARTQCPSYETAAVGEAVGSGVGGAEGSALTTAAADEVAEAAGTDATGTDGAELPAAVPPLLPELARIAAPASANTIPRPTMIRIPGVQPAGRPCEEPEWPPSVSSS